MTEDEASSDTGPRRRPKLRRVAGVAFAVLALAGLGAAVYRQRTEFAAAVALLDPASIVLAGLAVLAGLVCNMLSWRASMASTGAAVPLLAGARVFFVSQLGKYLPGSVWPLVAQVELTKARGIPRVRSATAALVAMTIGVVTSSVIGTTLLVAAQRDALERYWWLLAVALAGALTLWPPVLRRLLDVAARVLRRPSVDVPIAGRSLAAAIGWSVVMWAFFGAQAWVLAGDLGGGDVTYLEATGAFALAWVVGFLVVLAPAGVGVREVALVVALGGALTPGAGLALALVSRGIMTLADAILAGLGMVTGSRAAAADPVSPAGPGPSL